MNENDRNRLGGTIGGTGFGARGPIEVRQDNDLDRRDDLTRDPTARTSVPPAGGLGGAGAAATGVRTGGVVSAVFDSDDEARRAVDELRDAGVSDSALSIIARHEGRTTTTSGSGEVTDEGHTNILRGILGGGALGAGLGVAALAIPGVGPLALGGAIAAGVVPEAMALGAAAGAVGGTLNEVLRKHGVSDEDARYYGDRIKNGGVFVSVDTSMARVSPEMASDILYRNGGHSAARARMA